MSRRGDYGSGQRNYQTRLQWNMHKGRLSRKLPLLILSSAFGLVIVFFVFYIISWTSWDQSQANTDFREGKKPADTFSEKLSSHDLSMVLEDAGVDFADFTDHFVVEKDGVRLEITSSLDPDLQNYIIGLLRRSQTLQAAVVVLRPDDGRILAMTSYEKDGAGENLCLSAVFPAASLFKIVSAAAALESAGFTPDQAVFFQGRRHTLYKGQLKNTTTGRYVSETSFRKAFATSINPVFGKLGIHSLGRTMMSEYADRFYFNQQIPFDLPVEKSTIQIPDDEFGLAEIASGFNKTTLISPLHAALLASVAANEGIMMTPWLVKCVRDGEGNMLYEACPNRLASPITAKTARDLKILMRDTVVYGTCRKSYRQLRRKKVFKNVELGAKTGTINDETDQFKYDWFTAYALPPDRNKGICIAILGVHGKKLGIRSKDLARYIINHHITS